MLGVGVRTFCNLLVRLYIISIDETIVERIDISPEYYERTISGTVEPLCQRYNGVTGFTYRTALS